MPPHQHRPQFPKTELYRCCSEGLRNNPHLLPGISVRRVHQDFRAPKIRLGEFLISPEVIPARLPPPSTQKTDLLVEQSRVAHARGAFHLAPLGDLVVNLGLFLLHRGEKGVVLLLQRTECVCFRRRVSHESSRRGRRRGGIRATTSVVFFRRCSGSRRLRARLSRDLRSDIIGAPSGRRNGACGLLQTRLMVRPVGNCLFFLLRGPLRGTRRET